MASLNILSGGAAQGLVASLADKFREQTGLEIAGEFGAVGAMADQLRQGRPTDVVILTKALVAKLAADGLVVPRTIRDVGQVETALAVRTSDPRVLVKNAEQLREAFLAADAIHVPDTKTSTAGLHVAKVLGQLGVAEAVAGRLKISPNGAIAMRQLAESDAARPLGCTQATEIIATKGVQLSGSLPRGFDLATVYTSGITVQSANAAAAQVLIELLISIDSAALRDRAGFLTASGTA